MIKSRKRRRQAASLQEQAAVLAEKRQRQEEAALLERQEIIGHYKHSVLGDKSAYVYLFNSSRTLSQTMFFSSLPRPSMFSWWIFFSDAASDLADLQSLIANIEAAISVAANAPLAANAGPFGAGAPNPYARGLQNSRVALGAHILFICTLNAHICSLNFIYCL